MKYLLKICLLLVCTFSFSILAVELPETTDHEKVTIYLFKGNGCPHCQHAEEFFKSLGEEYKTYFNVVAYEVWYNKENSSLAQSVATALGDKFGGVPYIVIGDSYHTAGFADYMGESIINAAFEEYKNENYVDVVVKTKAVDNLPGTYETIFGNFEEPEFNIKEYNKHSKVNISGIKKILSNFSFVK